MRKNKNQLATNKNAQVMLQCSSQVKANAVRRETVGGVEYVVVSSYTMPDNIVMNGILYPSDEIKKSFKSLEGTLAPVEHPQDKDGNFLPAANSESIQNFYAGASNRNVTQEGNRLHVEKWVNVSEALKTDRGKRLLDRIEELETNDKPRAIHTSTGVYLVPEDTDGPQLEHNGIKTNAEFYSIARDMVFDHDAILLDSIGAAQPSQGVGMAVNRQGDICGIIYANLDESEVIAPETPDIKELSHEEISSALMDAIRQAPFNGDWIVRVYPTTVIFESQEKLFSAPYMMDGATAVIVGLPLTVERDETFKPKANQQGDDQMKELIVSALKAAGVDVSNLDESALFAKYNELQAQNVSDDQRKDNTVDIAAVVANALAPVTEELKGLKAQLNAKEESKLSELAEIVGNSDKYPGLNSESAKLLGVDTLRAMASNCGSAHGIPVVINAGGSKDQFSAPAEMPE